jgi:hypothetical protein
MLEWLNYTAFMAASLALDDDDVSWRVLNDNVAGQRG